MLPSHLTPTHAPHRHHQIPIQRCCDICHRLLTALQFILIPPPPVILGRWYPWLPVHKSGSFSYTIETGLSGNCTGDFAEASEPTFKQQTKGEKIMKRQRSQCVLLGSGSPELSLKEGPGAWGLFTS